MGEVAEFDMLLVDADNHIAFAEVVTSPSDLKEFEEEIAFKKPLLGYLYGQSVTPFLLISSFDLSNYSVVKRLAKDKTNAIIHTTSCEEIKSVLKYIVHGSSVTIPDNHPELVSATTFPMKNPFDYKHYHDEVRTPDFR